MLAHVEQEVSTYIAYRTARADSSIRDQKLTRDDWDRLKNLLKGDAGEGFTYVRLLERYDSSQIIHKEALRQRYHGALKPDFAIQSKRDPNKLAAIVDAKAWYPKGWRNKDLDYLFDNPESKSVINMHALRQTVAKYAAAPDLEPDGRVLLFFPREIYRGVPNVKKEIESWSGSELTSGRTVEVLSMEVCEEDLREAMKARR